MVEFHGAKVTFKLALALAVVFGFRLPSVALARWPLLTPREGIFEPRGVTVKDRETASGGFAP